MKFHAPVVIRGTIIVPLIFFLSSFCFSQISVSNLFREKTAKAGAIYKDKIVILNTSQQKKEVLIRKKNLKMTIDGIKFIDCKKEEYSLCDWLKLKWERFHIEPMSKVTIPYKVVIPEKVEPATYHCLLIISAKIPVKEKRGVGIAVQHAIQILYHVSGGRKNAEIFNFEMGEDNILNVDVRNIGNYWMPLKISNDLLGEKNIKIYNGQERRVKFNCAKLEDKFYKNMRVILDDGMKFLKAEFISFRKGKPPPPLPDLKKIRSERIARRRKGKPYSLHAGIQYGKRRKGLALSGDLKFWDFSFNFGSNYSEYFYREYSTDFQSYRFSGNWRMGKFYVGMGNFFYNSMWTSTIRSGLNWRGGSANLNYGLKYKLVNLNISQRLKLFGKNFNLRIYGFHSSHRTDYNVSLSFKIL